MVYSAPKEIVKDSRVESCEDTEIYGGDRSEYRHFVVLKKGFWFGFPYQCRTKNLRNVEDWRYYRKYIEQEPNGVSHE